jgi:alpha galactosidase A-like protein/cellulose binding protein with CBM2 domain/alpha galactosidase C-like protein
MGFRHSTLARIGVIAVVAGSVIIAGRAGSQAAPNNVVSTPPMGWASWNTFAAKINYNVIKAQVDALVSSGLKDAGYQYVNIDEGWWQGTRDSAGNITVDTAEWPGGMKAIADYIHSKGLKAGIYTDAGRDGCGYYYPTGRPAAPGSGSEGHYDQDFLRFSQWGFDFVKVDWCGGNAEGLNPRTAYTAISDAIGRATAQTGRPMVLSLCSWGNGNPWEWGPGISTMWRTSQDIIYYGQSPSMDRVLTNFDSAQHPTAQSPGHYNDPDMLIVGMPGFTAAQNRSHMSLWAISGAPLLAGNDLTTMGTETRDILANREVLAVDQDPLGRQGTKVAEDQAGRQVWSKTLSGSGRRAVVLLNRNSSAAAITVRWANLGLSSPATIRDPWTGTDVGTEATGYTTTVPAKAAVLLIITDSSGTPATPSPTPSTAAPTPSATASPTVVPAASCRITYRTNTWSTGLTAAIRIANTGSSPVNGWSLTFTLPAGQAVTNGWNATYATGGGQVTATNVSYNATIPGAGQVEIGFQATHTGNAGSPSAFTLNGRPCEAG